MYRLFLLISFSFIMSQGSYNPCEDKMYVKIIEKDLDEMSAREYD